MGGDKLMEQIFNLKFTAKQLNKSAAKCDKDNKSEKLKCKKAMEKGQTDIAKTYAENAIRKRNEQLNYIKLASRLDAVVSRLDTQAKMQMVNKTMAGIVTSLDKALSSNNLDKITATMTQFEKQFETLDVQAEMTNGVMSQQAAMATPEQEVNDLMQEVADEHGMDVAIGMPSASGVRQAAPSVANSEDLTARLAELRK